MIPVSILARNQTKAWAQDPDVTGSGYGNARGLDKGTEKKELAKGDASGQSTPNSRETSSHERESRAVREDRSR